MAKKSPQAAALSTAVAAALSTDQVAALSTDQQAALTTTDVTSLATSDLPALSIADTAPAPAPKAKAPVKPALPAQVTLAGLYGFFDDDDGYLGWAEGQVVTDPAHIELLIARAAPLVA